MGGEDSVYASRRAVLKTGITAVSLGVAGCQGSNDDGDSGRTTGSKRSMRSTKTRTASGTTTKTGADSEWPLHLHDARNTSYAPNLSGAGASVERRFRWRGSVPENASEGGRRSYNYTPPVVADGRVYCVVAGTYLGGGDSDDVHSLIALDTSNGDIQWERSVEPSGAVNPSPPLYVDGTLIHGRHALKAFDPSDGTLRWENPEASWLSGSTVAGDSIIVFGPGRTRCYDRTDGTERWMSPVGGRGRPAVDGSDVFVTVGSEIIALERTTGEEQWRVEHDAFPSVFQDMEDGQLQPGPLSTPVLDDDTVYVAAGSRAAAVGDHGGLVAFDRSTGEPRFTLDVESELGSYATPVEGERFSDPTGLYGPPALAEGRLYVRGWVDGPPDSKLFAVDAATGTITRDTDTAGMGLYTQVTNETVIVVSGNYLETFDRSTGESIGNISIDISANAFQPAAVGDEAVFVPTQQGIVGYD